jgi:predicted nuclease of predicted toxin-antitoxin system
MRFLADAGISPKTVDFLRRAGHDAVHVRELAMQRASDRGVAERARSDGRILLTFDLDFGAVLALGVVDRPSVIIFRLSDERAEAVLAEQAAALASGALVLVEDSRYRIRTLPIRSE